MSQSALTQLIPHLIKQSFFPSMAPGGGGYSGIYHFRIGGVPLKAAKPVTLSSTGYILAEKGTSSIKGYSQENCVFVYFSDEKSENI